MTIFGTMNIYVYLYKGSAKCGKLFRHTNTNTVRMHLLVLYGLNWKWIFLGKTI